MSILPCFINGYLMPNVFHEFYSILNYNNIHMWFKTRFGENCHILQLNKNLEYGSKIIYLY